MSLDGIQGCVYEPVKERKMHDRHFNFALLVETRLVKHSQRSFVFRWTWGKIITFNSMRWFTCAVKGLCFLSTEERRHTVCKSICISFEFYIKMVILIHCTIESLDNTINTNVETLNTFGSCWILTVIWWLWGISNWSFWKCNFEWMMLWNVTFKCTDSIIAI